MPFRKRLLHITAITYLIHNSESEEIWECQKLFNIFDVNNDGRISFSDFFGQMEKLSGETMDKTEAQKLFHIIDTNKSNYIEQEEFVKAGVDKTIFLEEKMLKLAFNFFDITNDGSISFEDIIELFRDSTDMDKDKEAKDEYEKIIKSFDKNNDGKLNFEGFSAFMKAVLQN